MNETIIFLFLLYGFLVFSTLQLFYLKSVLKYRVYNIIIIIFCLIFFNDHPALIVHGVIIIILLLILFIISFNKKITKSP